MILQKWLHNKEDIDMKRSNKTKEIFERVVKNLQSIVANGEYENFLKFQKKLKSKYSFSNLVLIFSQLPTATQVARKKSLAQTRKGNCRKCTKNIYFCPYPQKIPEENYSY